MDCFWCSKDVKRNQEPLAKFCSAEITVELQYQMTRDLIDCYDCILAYHSAKQCFVDKHPSADKELLCWELERLCEHINHALKPDCSDDEDSEIFHSFQDDISPAFGFGDGVELKQKLSIPLQEILHFPYLLWNKKLCCLAIRALLSLEEAGSPLILDGKLPGIYLLLIHPNTKVRKWARKSVNFLGAISCDDYDDLSNVVKWILGVPEFGLFQSPELGDDLATQASYTILPSHLFVQHSVKEFWLGVCMFLKAMETSTVRLQLVSRENHQAFVGNVVRSLDLNYANDKEKAQGDDSEFWPILHCFVILMERLGSRTWQYVKHSEAPTNVFKVITKHPAYEEELRKWPGFSRNELTSSSCDDTDEQNATISSSQVVYNWDGRRRRTYGRSKGGLSEGSFIGKGKRRKVVFAWFKPYVTSVVEFGDIGSSVVKNVLKYLHELKSEYAVASEGYDNSISAMVVCLDQLPKSCLRSTLTIASDLWIPDVVGLLSRQPKPSHGQTLANAFCKSLLERMAKRGANVSQLLAWLTNKSYLTDPDETMLIRLKNLFFKFFKCEVTSPTSSRLFERERRMIVQPKPSRSNVDNKTSVDQPNKLVSPNLVIKRDYKFVMSAKKNGMKKMKLSYKSPPSDNTKYLKIPKVETVVTEPPVRQQSPLLEVKLQIEKLKVSKNGDAFVVDSSGDECPPRKTKIPQSKLGKSLLSRVKEERRKTSDGNEEASSSGTAYRIPSNSFYGKSYAPGKPSSNTIAQKDDHAKSLMEDNAHEDDMLETICSQVETTYQQTTPDSKLRSLEPVSNGTRIKRETGSDFIEVLDNHEDDDLIESICSQIETKHKSPMVSKKNKKEREAAKVKVKTEPRDAVEDKYIVISDDSDDEEKGHKQWTTASKLKPKSNYEYKVDDNSDESWLVIENIKEEGIASDLNKFPDPHKKLDATKVKQENTGYGIPDIKKENVDDIGSNLQPQVKVKNEPKEDTTEEHVKEETGGWDCFMYDHNDDDVISSCLDTKDDVMTCVEAYIDLDAELDDTIVLSSDSSPERLSPDPTTTGSIDNDRSGQLAPIPEEDMAAAEPSPEYPVTNSPEYPRLPSPAYPAAAEKPDVQAKIPAKSNAPDLISPEHLSNKPCFGPIVSKLKNAFKNASATLSNHASEKLTSVTQERENDPGEQVPISDSTQKKIISATDIPTCAAEKIPTKVLDKPKKPAAAKVGIVRPLLDQTPVLQRSLSAQEPLKHPLQPVRANSYSGTTNTDVTTATTLPAKTLSSKAVREVVTTPKRPLSIEEFYYTVLKWDARLLDQNPIKPPVIRDYGRVCRTFDSVDHYYTVFKPLVFLEIWGQVLREWGRVSKKEYSLTVDSVNHFVTHFQLLKCKKSIKFDGTLEVFLQDNDLVIVQLKDEVHTTCVFGIVESVNKEFVRDKSQGEGPTGGQQVEYTVILRMLPTARSPLAREVLNCVFVTSLVTFERQWKGLMFLPKSLLARDILQPRICSCKTDDVNIAEIQCPANAFNESQLKSIERTCEAIRKPYPIPKICFIQGPPGTGKSHTIIGLIKKHLKNRSMTLESERENRLPGAASACFNQTSGRVLLCAPSNAAIDVLVRRLVADMRELGTIKGKNCGSVNLVRVGRMSAIHRQVKAYTLDVLSKTEVAKLEANDVLEEKRVQAQLEALRQSIEKLEKECYVLRCSGHDNDSEQVKRKNAQIEEVVKKKKPVERRYGEIRLRTRTRKRQEAKIRKDILFSADIICSTLNGSGSMFLRNELLNNKKKHLPFGCVIVDEACQSCELDLLIPLQFGSSKLIMVGDPEQLRTTILSQRAQELSFGQSLYERHYRVFRERAHEMGKALHTTSDNPIQMLDVQYRMHPNISAFPSAHVYQGRLKDARNVSTRPPICSLKPYIIFNVQNGFEKQCSGGSVCNPLESEFVAEICSMLKGGLQPKHIGIITPYRGQAVLLEKQLTERGMDKIEVNTVDGFQGREKEIIIMSCVRANGQSRGIGFLADRQRMNVALTRARYSLVILLHRQSLLMNKDWKACMDDSEKRGFLHNVSTTKDLKNLIHIDVSKQAEIARSGDSSTDTSPKRPAIETNPKKPELKEKTKKDTSPVLATRELTTKRTTADTPSAVTRKIKVVAKDGMVTSTTNESVVGSDKTQHITDGMVTSPSANCSNKATEQNDTVSKAVKTNKRKDSPKQHEGNSKSALTAGTEVKKPRRDAGKPVGVAEKKRKEGRAVGAENKRPKMDLPVLHLPPFNPPVEPATRKVRFNLTPQVHTIACEPLLTLLQGAVSTPVDTAEPCDFDFDDFEPEELPQASSASAASVGSDVVDHVVSSGAVVLAQSDPYLLELMRQEMNKGERHCDRGHGSQNSSQEHGGNGGRVKKRRKRKKKNRGEESGCQISPMENCNLERANSPEMTQVRGKGGATKTQDGDSSACIARDGDVRNANVLGNTELGNKNELSSVRMKHASPNITKSCEIPRIPRDNDWKTGSEVRNDGNTDDSNSDMDIDEDTTDDSAPAGVPRDNDLAGNRRDIVDARVNCRDAKSQIQPDTNNNNGSRDLSGVFQNRRGSVISNRHLTDACDPREDWKTTRGEHAMEKHPRGSDFSGLLRGKTPGLRELVRHAGSTRGGAMQQHTPSDATHGIWPPPHASNNGPSGQGGPPWGDSRSFIDREQSGTSNLCKVIERVKAQNPAPRPPPMIEDTDNLAGFRRYHGGPRERVAHANLRTYEHTDPHDARNIMFSMRDYRQPIRRRNPTNTFNKIRKNWRR